IEHHAALGDVVEPEVQAGVRVPVAGAGRDGADAAAGRAFRRLDLDHVGAHGRQQLAQGLARRVAGQLDDREIAVRRGLRHQIAPDAVSSANSSSLTPRSSLNTYSLSSPSSGPDRQLSADMPSNWTGTPSNRASPITGWSIWKKTPRCASWGSVSLRSSAFCTAPARTPA